MKYQSTRGGVSGLSFEDALFSGFTSDGGILLPETIPSVDPRMLRSWSSLTYPDLVLEIAKLFIAEDEIPGNDLQRLIASAFSRFSEPDIIKTQRLSSGLNVLELFHGPTLAFKDLALSCLGQFIEYFLEKRQKHVTILVGTSGDTGAAAIEAVRGLRWADIVVLLPAGRCSRIQERMMTTVDEPNVHVFRVDGGSDELDVPIKACFLDAAFQRRHSLASINSINWARILVQIAHYFYAYFQVRPDCRGEAEIVVPTGACGNITSGLMAVEMGLPATLVCATTVNDIVVRTISGGDFSAAGVVQTLAPAMDIEVPYNMERLLYLLSGGDAQRVCRLMRDFETDSKMVVPEDLLKKMQRVLSSYRVTDAAILATMKECHSSDQYLLCPHTATAAAYHYSRAGSDGASRVCLATASPAKFEEAVRAAGLSPQPAAAVAALEGRDSHSRDLARGEDWEAVLRETVETITRRAEG